MAVAPDPPRVRLVWRCLAGLACPAFAALGVLLFPLGARAEWPAVPHLVPPLTCLGLAVCCGQVALTGRVPRWARPE